MKISLLLQLSYITVLVVCGQCLGNEKALLLKLQKSLTFNSSRSTKLVRWDLNTDCCLWPGVSCDQEGHVLVLELDHEVITSRVPEFIADFTKLTTLSLRSCKLFGPFPSKIFQVQTLQELDLSYNENLIGTLPDFPQKSALREVVLSNTGFTSSLPDSIANLRNLTRLDIGNCNFSGDIPSKMGSLTDLVYLDMSFNSFTGSIPFFHKAKKLVYINLSNNNGPFSSTQTQIAVLLSLPSLQFLSIQNSRLSGEIHEFSNASSSVLDTLDLRNNHLNGSIPRSIFQIKSLSELVLSSNSFSGTINLEAISGLPRLTTLDLSYNNLRIVSNSTSFPFPAEMHHLRLASCQLQKFPDLKNQSFLFELDLSDNKIRGGIPNWVWKVGILNLSHNLLESLEQSHMSTTPLSIDLSCNRIKGKPPYLPPDIAATYHRSRWGGSITFLSLANNEFTGSIPSFICNLYQLKFLDMSNNSFNNKIPSCLFQKADRFVVLNLGRNKLNGTIPDTFPLNCSLRTLDLSSNILEGTVPRSLLTCQPLEVLNIGNNKIEDTFPCMFHYFSNLHVLVMRLNKFYGDLQCSVANQTWSSIQIVDLAYNNFSGALLPQYFSNLKGMMQSRNLDPGEHYLHVDSLYQDKVTLTIKGLTVEYVKILVVLTSIDFSCNNFQGEIPETLGDLKSLIHLNFSHNALTGRIPKPLGKLTQFESLDFSVNHLSGRTPDELVSLTFLAFLNLSFNQLSGRIPSGNQFQTFSADSFEGNIGLCGLPLKKTCNETKVNGSSQPNNHSEHEIDGKYIRFSLGSSVAFGIVTWLLLRSQRYNELVDGLLLRILGQHKRRRKNKNQRRSRKIRL
ncbi:hypothetical protein EJD97_023507 [Solanum chilense]|uniref:Leucine-rich repeat-containing N-terminal plant-type domain-containing protein n=1 Tax=Solanum chilense TaxID=4083 RepID=A0A6N2AU28_SOLCI|nr:hypothetical protein EJD97_023507 [Solanum chilense]